MSNLLYNLAQPFSDTKQYTQGTIVVYNDRMYEMTASDYTPGAFNHEKFTERFLSEMMSGKLNSNLGNFKPFYWYGETFNNFSAEFNIVKTHGLDVSITKRDTDIYFNMRGANDGNNPRAFIQFDSTIDVTNLKQLVILGYNKTTASSYTSLLYAGISKTSGLTDFSSMEKYTSNSTVIGNAILIIDVSNLVGKYNLYTGLEYTYAGASYYGYGNCYAVFGV